MEKNTNILLNPKSLQNQFVSLEKRYMKKYFWIVAFALAVSSTYAQKIDESKVPANVKQAFAKAYPNSKSIKWNKEQDGWEASFKQNKTEMSVVMDTNGSITEVESEIEESQLPAPIRKSFNREFIHYTFKEAAKIVAGSTTTYEIEAIKDKDKFEFIYDPNGKLLKKKELKKEEEEND